MEQNGCVHKEALMKQRLSLHAPYVAARQLNNETGLFVDHRLQPGGTASALFLFILFSLAFARLVEKKITV